MARAGARFWRVLPDHGVQPQVCHSVAERATTAKAVAETGAGAEAALRPGGDRNPDGGLEGGGLSMVGAIEGAAAQLDAVDSPALLHERGNRTAITCIECEADGSPVGETGNESGGEEVRSLKEANAIPERRAASMTLIVQNAALKKGA